MKIADPILNKPKLFWDLKQGDVFKTADNGVYYMKTEPMVDGWGTKCKAVCLNDGFMMDIGDNTTVTVVDHELTVK